MVIVKLSKVTDWPPIGKIAAHSAYEMFSWKKYLIVSLVFSHFGFWSGNLFLIAPFPDLCLLVPFQYKHNIPIVWTLKHYFGIFLILTLLYTEIKYCLLS